MNYHRKEQLKMDKKIKANTLLKILYLEDTPRDAEIVRELILDSGYNLEMEIAEVKEEYETFLRTRNYDIILSDFKLPGFDAFGALQLRNEICTSVPFICVSGSIGEETAIELLKLGADDYVLKDKPERLPFAIKRAIADARERAEHLKAEELLRGSELRFRQISESAHEWIWEVDKNGLYTFVSPIIKELLGYEAEELVGINYFYDLFEPENKEEMKKGVLDAFGRKENFINFVHTNIHKDGRKIILSTTGFPILDKENNLIGYRGADVDITEQLHAQQELQNREAYLSAIIENQPGLVWLKNTEGRFLAVNNAFALSCGKQAAKEVLGKTDHDLWLPELAAKYRNDDEEVMKNAIPISIEELILDKGEETWFETFKTPVKDLNGKIIGTTGFARNITERKRAAEEISRMANILEATPDFVGMADVKGKVFFLNHGGKLMMGMSGNEDITKLKVSDFHTEEMAKFIIGEAMPAATKEGHWSGETKLLSRTGEEIPVLQTILCHKDSNNNVTHYSTIVRDIRESRRTEEKVQKLSLAVEQSPVSVVITNKEGEIEYVNNKFYELTGYTLEEVKDKNPKILKSGRHSKSFYEELWSTILSGKVWKGEILNKKKNGEIYWESESISPLVNSEGEITHFVAMKEDITERIRMISELYETKEKAESASKLKDAFINNISHEIRTPLNGIVGLSSLIKESYSQYMVEDDESLFTGIDSSTQRIIRTIDMILNYSLLQSGEFTVIPKQINLIEICERVIKQNSEAAEMKSIELLFDNRCNGTKITGDEYTITQIVSNLVENAIKYTKKGTIEITLLPGTDHSLILEVKDTGIGIAEEYLAHLFEPYRQEEMGYGRAYEGLGLGLALTKKYCDLNKAELTVTSKKEEGTTFTIEFKGTGESQIDQFKLTERIVPVKPLQSKREEKTAILIVEDDKFNQDILKRFLKKNYTTHIAESADEAYGVLEKNKIDLILMDISIQGEKDGLELTKELKGTKKYSKIPVIAVTAHAGNDDQRNAAAAGCDDYLAKPYSMDQLFIKIGKFV